MKNHSSHLDGLNPAQRAAVTFGITAAAGARTEGTCSAPPLLVIAGAGTGKTKTLATRVAHLILNGADPRRLLLLTFARRMASEMLRRVEHICAQALDQRMPLAAQAVEWSGTFHAVGAKLLRLYAGSIGLDPAFSILDRSDSADLMDLARDELVLMQPLRFYVRGQGYGGDRSVYAPRSRFIAESDLEAFELAGAPQQPSRAEATMPPPAANVDLKAGMREMWR